MPSGAAIRTEGLTKFYGSQRGIDGLDLEVVAGEVFGFLGPNGAGKTTTIRLLLDLIRPTGGRAEVLGLDPQHDSVAVRKRVGYLPGELSLYDTMTARQLFDYFGALRGVRSDRALSISERLGLDPNRKMGTLSKGNKQKVGVVQAFMHEPELLILDEPTSGLDPLVQQTFHSLVRECSQEGATVFLSSHVLSEIEDTADRVGIIRDGRLVVVEHIGELRAKALRRFQVRFAQPVPAGTFEAVDGVRSAEVAGEHATVIVEGHVDPFLKAVSAREVVDLTSHEPDLEEIFLTYYQEPDR